MAILQQPQEAWLQTLPSEPQKHFIEVQDEILTQTEINQNVMNQVALAEEQSDEAEDTLDQ